LLVRSLVLSETLLTTTKDRDGVENRRLSGRKFPAHGMDGRETLLIGGAPQRGNRAQSKGERFSQDLKFRE